MNLGLRRSSTYMHKIKVATLVRPELLVDLFFDLSDHPAGLSAYRRFTLIHHRVNKVSNQWGVQISGGRMCFDALTCIAGNLHRSFVQDRHMNRTKRAKDIEGVLRLAGRVRD